MAAQKDNSTFDLKVALRRRMLSEIADPVIMETNGGYGKLYTACYSHIVNGVVIEKDNAKAEFLARQRPSWSVYQADCAKVIAAGAGRHLTFNLLDVDPYGDPWPIIEAFLSSDRPRPVNLYIVVNDGLRQKIKRGGAWQTRSMEEVVHAFGNDLYTKYLDICNELFRRLGSRYGWSLSRFAGYYCGAMQQMTHYTAVLIDENSSG